MKGAVPILMYHQVTPCPRPEFRRYAITPRAFAAQTAWLALAGYRTIGLDALLDHRDSHRPLPSRCVIITFDDGLQDCVDHVAPVLSARGFTATFYLVADLVGKTSRWTLPELGIELPLMDWRAVRSLEAAGFQCGSHTMSHARLPELSSVGCREELSTSRRLLEDRLGHDVTHLAYPFGAFDDRVRAMAADAGYRSACSTRRGLSAPDDDALALHRVTVYGHDSLLDFACRLRTADGARELLRRRLRRALARLRPTRAQAT